jgi:hypothetical protein
MPEFDENENSAVSEAVEAEPEIETVAVGKESKTTKTGNLILDIATEVESLSRQKALKLATTLATDIEVNYFKLGGVLQVVNDNSWFEGFPDFDSYVYESFGFQGRKARYLISIYDNLVKKQIPWEAVQHLGWTKLKDLAPILTLENVDEWVEKASKVTVVELQALLKATGPTDGAQASGSTKSDLVVMKFSFKNDQAEIVNQALAKAKGELNTEYDTVAAEGIFASYLGGEALNKSYDLDTVIKNTGFDTILTRISELYPEWDITVAEAAQSSPTPTE